MTLSVDVAISAMRATLGGNSALYISCPIMSGLRKYQGRAEFERENIAAAITVGDNIRARSFAHIIEPARFQPINGWSHEDYMAMWYEVIRRFVFTAVFVRDWEYSGGCCNEYAFAAELGLPRVDENLEPISTWTALDMMLAASERIRQLGKASPIRDAATAKLAKIIKEGKAR